MERCRLIANFIIEWKKTINRLQDREEDEVIDIFIDWIKNVFTKRFKKVLPRNIKFNNRRDIAMFSVALDEIYDNLCREREEAANVKKELQRLKKEKDEELLKMMREKEEELREKEEKLREKDEELLREKKKNEELEKKLISLLGGVKKRTV